VIRLSGVVLAQDEEQDLPRCLAALSFCDEIVVIDGGSRDRTADVARSAGARVVAHAWPGYGAQRQFSLGEAQGEFVLAVDADEVVDDELRGAVVQALADPAPRAGYRVRVANQFMGRELRFGGLGHDYHTRLFRREGASYPDQLHAGVRVAGPLGRLPGALRHQSYRDLSDYLAKTNRYTSALARERYARGARFSAAGAALRLPWGFFKRYLLQLGVLDGYPGFAHAGLSAFYDFLKVAKLRELEGSNVSPRLPGSPGTD
jgi:glycosyltransferase involved in cell wall biosynthesis